MTIGEKIKHYRTTRGYSQKALGDLSGINEVTIRKYELGDRHPKPDQLQKIADALNISVILFLEFDMQTISDVLSILFKLDEKDMITFYGESSETGKINADTISVRFKNQELNECLAQWAYTKHLLESAKQSDSSDTEETKEIIQDMSQKSEKIKQLLVHNTSNMQTNE